MSNNNDRDIGYNMENKINLDIREINRETDEIESNGEKDIQSRIEPVDNKSENRIQRESSGRERPKGLTLAESFRRKEKYLKNMKIV